VGATAPTQLYMGPPLIVVFAFRYVKLESKTHVLKTLASDYKQSHTGRGPGLQYRGAEVLPSLSIVYI
jgi:hypothetical protein